MSGSSTYVVYLNCCEVLASQVLCIVQLGCIRNVDLTALERDCGGGTHLQAHCMQVLMRGQYSRQPRSISECLIHFLDLPGAIPT